MAVLEPAITTNDSVPDHAAAAQREWLATGTVPVEYLHEELGRSYSSSDTAMDMLRERIRVAKAEAEPGHAGRTSKR